MANEDRTPVIVGVAQLEQREDDPGRAREPLALMECAIREAVADTGGRGVLASADSIRVIRGMWRYGNPARRLAEALGLAGVETGLTSLGGNYVQVVTNHAFRDVQAGRRELVVVTGAECGRTLARASRAGVALDWAPGEAPPGQAPGLDAGPGEEPELFLGSTLSTRHPAELARGIERPIHYYPIFELALRHALGEGVEEHLERISRLWEGFSRVAAGNPHAWIRRPFTAEEIRTPSPGNRPVSHPYPKLMNANVSVDQAAALVITSVARARALRIPEARWVHPVAGTEAWDHVHVSERPHLWRSPAIRLAGQRLFELAQAGPDDLGHVDLYSCFPSAVRIAARELGLSLERPLTVTGGLTFAGGPLNNYVMHAIARTVELLRRDRAEGRPARPALVTANGGLLTKHALCIYASEPPSRPFQWADVQEAVDRTPRRRVRQEHEGEVEVEAYAVQYAREEPEVAHVATLLPDGSRAWGVVREPEVLEAMIREEFGGRKARLRAGGALVPRG